MKVKDLILHLNECDPESMVVVDGYEGGVTELRNIKDRVHIALNVNGPSYYGPHEQVFENDEHPEAHHVYAVYLPR